MFRRRTPEPQEIEGIALVENDGILAYQRGIDPKTEAPKLIDQIRQDLLLSETHPWHALNYHQVRLALARVAMYNDRSAEIMCEEGAVKVGDAAKLPEDVAEFALAISKNATDQMDSARRWAPPHGMRDIDFDDDMRAALSPENQLPYWPSFTGETSLYEWQHPGLAGVTTQFLKGIVRAARELQGMVSEDLRSITKSPFPIPPEYEEDPSIVSVVERHFDDADINISTAEQLLMGSTVLPQRVKADAYVRAHDGYVGTMQAGLIIASPQLLGPDFAPIRTTDNA